MHDLKTCITITLLALLLYVNVTINPCFQDSSPLEVQLAPTGRELVRALRELLLQAHWHTFTLLADSSSATALQRSELWGPLSMAPLHPSLVSLPMPLRPHTLFR